MTKKEKGDYIDRIHAKRSKVRFTLWSDSETMFKVAMRTHSAVIAGNQSKKPSRKVMDEAFKRAFPSILSVIK